MANLFAQAASVGPAPIVTFRAGKMHKQGTTVHPDPRKGQVSVIYSHSDQLTHFQWKDRFSGNVEDDLIIFPEEAKFTKVDKARGGRVFILDFKDQPDRQLFFWMQEPKEDKDAEFVEKINRALNEPGGALAMQSTADAAGSAAPAANTQQSALAEMLAATMRQQGGQARSGQAPAATTQPASSAPRSGAPAADLTALANALTNALGVQVPVQPGAPTAGSGSAAARPAAPASGAGRTGPSPAELQMLQQMFSQQGLGAQQRSAGQPQQQTQQQQQQEPIDLNHVLSSPEAQAAIRENAAQLVSALSEHLPPRPDDTTGEEHLLNNLRSAQFRQTADILNAALSDPAAYHEVTTAFQLPQDAAATGFGVAPFLQRVQRLAPAQQTSTQAAGQQQGQQGQSQGDAPAQSNDDKMQE